MLYVNIKVVVLVSVKTRLERSLILANKFAEPSLNSGIGYVDFYVAN